MVEHLKSEIEFLEYYLKKEVRHVAFITICLLGITTFQYLNVFIRNMDSPGWSMLFAYTMMGFALVMDLRTYKKQKLKLQETRIKAIVESL